MKRAPKPYAAIRAIAKRDDLPEHVRAGVRAAITEPVADLVRDLSFAEMAIGGPDPEYAVFLLAQLLDDAPKYLAAANEALEPFAHARRRRAA